MIKTYYKELVRKFHPDLNNNSTSSKAIMRVVNNLRSENDLFGLKNLYERLIVFREEINK